METFKLDYYEILGVEFSATKSEITKAYRQLALKHHPDKGGDEARFKKINEAYQTLNDAKKKKDYDDKWRDHYSRGATGEQKQSHRNTPPHSRPSYNAKYAANFEGNPPRSNQARSAKPAKKPFGKEEIAHAIFKWFLWHPKTSVAIIIILFLWLMGR